LTAAVLLLGTFPAWAQEAPPAGGQPVNTPALASAEGTPEGPAYSQNVERVAQIQNEIDQIFGWVVEKAMLPVLFYSLGVREDARPVFAHDTAAASTYWEVAEGGLSGLLKAPEALDSHVPGAFLIDTREAREGGGGNVLEGVILSPPFEIDTDRINLLLAGGSEGTPSYAALVSREGEELARLALPEGPAFQLVPVATAALKGQAVRVKLVDADPAGFVALGGVYLARTGIPLIICVLVLGGVFFTFRYGFINIRLFGHAISVVRGHYDDPRDQGEISHFQALSSALAATVGLGNIAGVAVAITAGGPGAVFWMWVTAIFGMSMKFSSCTLAQVYRTFKPDGHVLGGPMVYLKDGIKDRVPALAWFGALLSPIFAVLTVFAAFGGGNMFQTNQTYNAINEIFNLQEHPIVKPVVGLVMAVLVGVVIIGGIRRIGEVTSKLVPAMCVGYIAVCLVIVFVNYQAVPAMFVDIVTQAFTGPALFGGFLGVLIQGMKRAAFSNEAGLGSAAIAHAAAKTDEPIREGLVAMLGPFIDTIIVCTMTAIAILASGVHLQAEGMAGVSITAKAFADVNTYFPYFLAVAVFIFAYSTLLGWSYYGERAIEYLFGEKGIGPYRTTYVLVAILGPLVSLNNVVAFADMMLLSMAFPNIIGMIFLSGKVNEMKRDYLKRLKSGEMKMMR
jgi:AGCS family alanine or glycine:cation symporter